jgi:hypothetical protein
VTFCGKVLHDHCIISLQSVRIDCLVISCMNAIYFKQLYFMLTNAIKTLEQETDRYIYPNINLNMIVRKTV